MADNKTKPTQISVMTFIEELPDETKRADVRALVAFLEDATGETATMWGPAIVGFGSYHYHYESGREGDAPLVSFSPRKKAIVLYGMTAFSGSADLLAHLGPHTTSGGCVHIKNFAGVNPDTLKALVLQSTEAKRSSH